MHVIDVKARGHYTYKPNPFCCASLCHDYSPMYTLSPILVTFAYVFLLLCSHYMVN